MKKNYKYQKRYNTKSVYNYFEKRAKDHYMKVNKLHIASLYSIPSNKIVYTIAYLVREKYLIRKKNGSIKVNNLLSKKKINTILF